MFSDHLAESQAVTRRATGPASAAPATTAGAKGWLLMAGLCPGLSSIIAIIEDLPASDMTERPPGSSVPLPGLCPYCTLMGVQHVRLRTTPQTPRFRVTVTKWA